MTRPICAHCGQPYGSRRTDTETLRWPAGTEKPAYRGNGILIRDRFEYQAAAGHMTCERITWDGETWFKQHEPFCKLRCALEYARKAYARSQQPALRRVR